VTALSVATQGLLDTPLNIAAQGFLTATSAADLAGSITVVVSAAGSLSSQIRLVGGAVSVVSSTGGLTTSIRLVGIAGVVATMGPADLLTPAALAGGASVEVTMTGLLEVPSAFVDGVLEGWITSHRTTDWRSAPRSTEWVLGNR